MEKIPTEPAEPVVTRATVAPDDDDIAIDPISGIPYYTGDFGRTFTNEEIAEIIAAGEDYDAETTEAALDTTPDRAKVLVDPETGFPYLDFSVGRTFTAEEIADMIADGE